VPADSANLSRVAELFGADTRGEAQWAALVAAQRCPYEAKRCYKVRKSDPSISIGTCTVRAGKSLTPLVICPSRFMEGTRVFNDVLPLMTAHEPGNDYHIVSEVSVPGGSVDYFVVSARAGKAVDFVGVEFQALDTTGTVWPHRQKFLASKGVVAEPAEDIRGFGVNWKMTAKTILVQLHHKIATFESVNRKLVLVLQDELMDYMTREFSFGHLAEGAPADSLHFHAYSLVERGAAIELAFAGRRSTDEAGIERALSLGQSGKVELTELLTKLNSKINECTRWQPIQATPPPGAEPSTMPTE